MLDTMSHAMLLTCSQHVEYPTMALLSGNIELCRSLLDKLGPTYRDRFREIPNLCLDVYKGEVYDGPVLYKQSPEHHPVIVALILGQTDFAQELIDQGWEIPPQNSVESNPGPESDWRYVNEGDTWGPMEIAKEARAQDNICCGKKHPILRTLAIFKFQTWNTLNPSVAQLFYVHRPRDPSRFSYGEIQDGYASTHWRDVWKVWYSRFIENHANARARTRAMIINELRPTQLPDSLIELIVGLLPSLARHTIQDLMAVST